MRKLSGTHKSTMNRRRKGKLAVLIPWIKRFGIALGALVFIGWAGSWLYLSGSLQRGGYWLENKVLTASGDMGFSVRNILVEGRQYTDSEILLAIINTEKGDPIFAFDPAEAQAMIEKIRWVESAHVERRLPDTIYIGLQERAPLAFWQQDQKLKLIDADGNIITSQKLSRFKDLIVVMGEDSEKKAAVLVSDLKAEPEIYDRTEAAKYISKRRWDIILKDGVTVKLPENDAGLAVSRLADAQRESGLLDKDIVSIDLREADRIVVRTRPGQVQEYKAGYNAGNNI